MLLGFRNIAILAKIAVPATIVAVVSIGIVLYASLAVTHLSDTAAALVDGNATRVQLALQAESAFNNAAISEKNVILSDDAKVAQGHIELYDKATAATLDAITQFEAITPGRRAARPDRYVPQRRRRPAGGQRRGVRTRACRQGEGGLRPFARRGRQASPGRHRGGQQADRHERGENAGGARRQRGHGRADPGMAGGRRRRRADLRLWRARLDRALSDFPTARLDDRTR